MHTHAFKAGQKLRNGAYEIIKVLGQGGFGITYLARFSSLDRMVAIKEFFISGYCVRNTTGADITPQSMAEEEYTSYKKKFIAEAKTLAKFAHPAIVPVSDIFEENNTAYFVMNYIEGASLADMIQQMGPIPSQDAQGYIRQAAEALEVVHGRNVLHRDIKPDNIMVRPNGRVVLIDFGTARAFVDSKTVTHTTLLTPGFAPLEQYSDRQQRGVYTDIYALGATLYNCLTGKIPPPAVDRLQKAELPDLPEGPLGEVIAKAMAMQTEARYQSIADFLTDLNQTEEPLQAEGVDEPVEAQTILSSGEATEILATPEPVTSTETSSTPSTSSSVSRTLIRILVPLLGMALLAVGGWWGWKYKLQQEQSDQKVQYQAAMVKAEAAMAQNDWEAAITSYQEALTHQDTPEAREQLRKAQSTLKAQADQEAERQRNFSQYLQKGDALFAEKEYNLAQFNYELARKYAHPDSLTPVDLKIAACKTRLETEATSGRENWAAYLGKHPLTLQWISWDYTGEAQFYEDNGVLKLTGEQLSREEQGDYVKMAGTVEPISDKHFVLDGEVRMRINHINGGKECVRKGRLNFKATGSRQYWRMREMNSPCDVTTDYVDIYFRKLND